MIKIFYATILFCMVSFLCFQAYYLSVMIKYALGQAVDKNMSKLRVLKLAVSIKFFKHTILKVVIGMISVIVLIDILIK